MQSIIVRDTHTQLEEEYLGLKHQFPDPYHLFLHKKDIQDSPLVRFIVMSMGKKKIIITGWYRGDGFHISYSCKYQTRQLTEYIREWNKDFDMSLVTTKNRITKRIESYSGQPSSSIIRNRNDYEHLKMYLALQPNSKYYISDEKIQDKIYKKLQSPSIQEYIDLLHREISSLSHLVKIKRELEEMLLSDDIDQIIQLQEDINVLMISSISTLDSELHKYEEGINIIQEYSRNERIRKINKEFYNWISTSKYSTDSWASGLDNCLCENNKDPGCQVLTWGENASLV